MIIIVFIGACVIIFGIIYSLIGAPLVIWDKIKEYHNTEMPKSEKRLWKINFVLLGILLFLLFIISLGISKS